MEYTSVVVAVDHIVYSKPCRKQAAHQVSTQCPTGAEVNQKEYLGTDYFCILKNGLHGQRRHTSMEHKIFM